MHYNLTGNLKRKKTFGTFGSISSHFWGRGKGIKNKLPKRLVINPTSALMKLRGSRKCLDLVTFSPCEISQVKSSE